MFVCEEVRHRHLRFEDFADKYRYFLIDVSNRYGRLFYSKIPEEMKHDITVICFAGKLDKWTYDPEAPEAAHHWLHEADVIKSKHPKKHAFQQDFELDLSTVKIKRINTFVALGKLFLKAIGINL